MSADDATFADEWYAAWNTHDLKAIMAHYDIDIVFRSPFAARLEPSSRGEVHGTVALALYFSRAIAAFPNLTFTPLYICSGVGALTLVYRSVEGRIAAETMVRNSAGAIVDVRAHYTDSPLTPRSGGGAS